MVRPRSLRPFTSDPVHTFTAHRSHVHAASLRENGVFLDGRKLVAERKERLEGKIQHSRYHCEVDNEPQRIL